MCGEAEDTSRLSPAKDDNGAAHRFICRTLPILDCVDYIMKESGKAKDSLTALFYIMKTTSSVCGSRKLYANI